MIGGGQLLLFHLAQLLVMKAAKGQLGSQRADQGEEHIPLGIPDIPLSTQKSIGRFPAGDCRPPFDELIRGADRKTDAGDKEEEHFSRGEGGVPKKNFPCNDRRNKPLCEVPDAIVMVPRKLKRSCIQKPSGTRA